MRPPHLLLLLALGACAARPTSRPAEAGTGVIQGEVRLADAVREAGPCRGRLVMNWLTEDEAAQERAHALPMASLIELTYRHRVIADVDLCAPGASASYRLEVPPGVVRVRAVLDIDRRFIRALYRRDVPGTRMGESSSSTRVAAGSQARLDVELTQVQQAKDTAALCSGERFLHLTVDAPEVAGRVGNPTKRGFCAWLPKSYATHPQRRYSVVYLLPGYGGDEWARFGSPRAHEAADAIAEKTGREVILVGVDTSTRLGSTYFEDTPLHGRWESFAVRMAREVDGKVRSLARADARALVGHSTGGFNAMSLGLRHPDVFGVVVAASPDALDAASGLLMEDGAHLRPALVRELQLNDALGADGQLVSWAADWSPDDSARGFAWPADVETGTLVPAVWQRWVAHAPAAMLENPALLANARALAGRLLLTVGSRDEFNLERPTRVFSERLTARGIPHDFEAYDEGHRLSAEGLAQHLDWATRHLPPAAP
ncbi:MAG: alpha/beta hydrolase-fold protein [Myxococcota bacterium]